MQLRRRDLGRASVLTVAASAVAVSAGAAESTAPNVVVYCDKALRPVLEVIGRWFSGQTGVPVNLFCAAPPLMLAQIERITQNDVLVTGAAAMNEAARRGLVKAATRLPLGRNRVVLATAGRSATPSVTDPTAIARLIGRGPLAAPDPTTATTIDTATVLARLGLRPPLPFPLLGAVDTEAVGFLLRTGAARFGLLYRTEAQAGSGLAIAAALAGTPSYAAVVSTVTRSRNAGAFMDFLRRPATAERLQTVGLEQPA